MIPCNSCRDTVITSILEKMEWHHHLHSYKHVKLIIVISNNAHPSHPSQIFVLFYSVKA